jgi:transposase-like protein
VSVEEIFRIELEKAFNQLLETELGCFLGYEKYSKDGYNTGDSRNGYYKRTSKLSTASSISLSLGI